jgi:hypothetical protein
MRSSGFSRTLRAVVVAMVTTLATGFAVSSPSVAAGARTPSATTAAHPKPALPKRTTGFHAAAPSAKVVPGRYIVKLQRTGSLRTLDPRGAASGLVGRYGGAVGRVYDTVLGGFSVAMSEAQARRLAADPAVEYVNPVRVARTNGSETTQRDPANWALDRIDQRPLPLSSGYTRDDGRGRDWKIYVLDSGVNRFHDDFDSMRAEFGTNTTGDGYEVDFVGHGTAVAGMAIGLNSGVNKWGKVVAVKVVPEEGGTDEMVIDGIKWVTSHASGTHNVANLSLSFPAAAGSDPIDDAIDDSVAHGITYTAAAGNDGDDACGLTPARNPNVITVSATTKTDARPSWANYGACVDIFAPGENLNGPVEFDNSLYTTVSGTSFAAPLVAGAITFLDFSNTDVTPASVRARLLANATKGAVSNPGDDSPNTLLYVGRATRPVMCSLGTRGILNPADHDPYYENIFTEYGNSNDGWTGADGTYSVDGVTGKGKLWIFSDTFMPPVNNLDGTRPRSAPLINNSIVEQYSVGTITTHTGGSSDAPDAIVPADADGDWYWAGTPNKYWTAVDHNNLQVVYQRYHRFGTGLWDWGLAGNHVATFGSDLGHPTSFTELPWSSTKRIAWGSAVYDYFAAGDGYTYVYGIQDVHTDTEVNKYLHIARVRGSDLRKTSDWEFLDSDGDWMPSQEFSAAQYDAVTGAHVAVSNEFSVTQGGSRPILVTQDSSLAFSGEIDLYSACSPSGPFGAKTYLYTTTEGGPWGSYGNGNIFTYNAKVVDTVLSFSTDEVFLKIAYNVNSLDPDDVYDDVTIYRPRFLRVTIRMD